MKWLSNLSVGKKIAIIPIVGVVAFCLYLGYSSKVSRDNAVQLNKIRTIYYPMLEESGKSKVLLEKVNTTLINAADSAEEDLLEDADMLADNMRASFQEMIILDPDNKHVTEAYLELFNEFYVIARKVAFDRIEGAGFASLGPQIEKMTNALVQLDDQITSMRNESLVTFTKTIDDANASSETSVKIGIIIALVTIVIISFTSISVVRLITTSLASVIDSLKDISEGEGDLTKRLPVTSKDEFGQLCDLFNLFLMKLQKIIGQVVGAVYPLKEVTDQLNSLTKRSESFIVAQQSAAASVGEAMQEMISAVENVSASAQAAAESADKADQAAQNGMRVVTETTAFVDGLAQDTSNTSVVIQKLGEDSDSVGIVLDVIKGIADQTNLLALNAAIEAARAGEQGRGFAVVADEVRTLAKKTQESTEEIHKIVAELQSAAKLAVSSMQTSGSKVEATREKSTHAGISLTQITDVVKTITEMNSQIAEATIQQSKVAENVQYNVTNIRNVIDQSEEGFLRVAEVGKKLVSLASELEAVAGQFKISDGDEAATDVSVTDFDDPATKALLENIL